MYTAGSPLFISQCDFVGRPNLKGVLPFLKLRTDNIPELRNFDLKEICLSS